MRILPVIDSQITASDWNFYGFVIPFDLAMAAAVVVSPTFTKTVGMYATTGSVAIRPTSSLTVAVRPTSSLTVTVGT